MNIFHKMHRGKREGFTLIELVVVLTIMGILLAVMAPAAINAKEAREEKEIDAYEKELAMELRQYYLKHGSKPFYIDEDGRHYVEESESEDEESEDFEEINEEPEGIFIALTKENRFHFKEDYKYRYSRDGLFGKMEVRKK